MRKFQFGCGVIAQNFLLYYFLFKITINPSKNVKFPSEKPKDMSDDGTGQEKKHSLRNHLVKVEIRKKRVEQNVLFVKKP